MEFNIHSGKGELETNLLITSTNHDEKKHDVGNSSPQSYTQFFPPKDSETESIQTNDEI